MKTSETRRCGWCQRPLDDRPGAGRPRRFCCPSHRQRAYEARRRAGSLEIPDGQVLVAEADLRVLHDRLYRLESAVEDVYADLTEKSTARDYREALEHVMDAAYDLVGMVVEPARA